MRRGHYGAGSFRLLTDSGFEMCALLRDLRSLPMHIPLVFSQCKQTGNKRQILQAHHAKNPRHVFK